jgi:putative ABC transport system permease protein
LGLPQKGELRRPVDRQLHPLDLPPHGLVLNTKLAELLAARPGDILTIEILEGARPVRQVPVVALADEPIGLGAYMDVAALHTMMREGDTISGAYN